MVVDFVAQVNRTADCGGTAATFHSIIKWAVITEECRSVEGGDHGGQQEELQGTGGDVRMCSYRVFDEVIMGRNDMLGS